ncbi:hypothetical protein GQ602_004596 [Ophiocordyceps camponoti-floridani]|uniref:Uncharacterized protein n=1 Tax=Ophiocordyceps camponoti-floridani TaxID=2030778 RepID=A0A8H4VDX7_9HYPO|nr:hypothetical protein GQ602_004596 [Ophiocordyceps camponoti-floridani]
MDQHRQPGLPRAGGQQLVVSHEGRRPLFAAASNASSKSSSSASSLSKNLDADLPRRPKSVGSTPRETRIPRPSRGSHKSISEAFRMAKEECGLLDGSPSPAPRPWRTGQSEDKLAALPDLVPGIDDMPLPSVESPEKGFAWQIEDDFTAGDLQVSDSPRIKVASNRPFAHRPSLVAGARSSTKTTASTTRPAWGSSSSSSNQSEKRKPRVNSKLDDIHAREKQHASTGSDRPKPRPKNPKLDEIREREAKMPSKRAYAASRLDEIHEKNFDSRSISRSVSPPAGGDKIPNTPVTVFRGSPSSLDATNGTAAEKPADSRDLLRRLARAASASPAPETEQPPQPRRRTREEGAKPTVTFAGLRRVDSTESAKSKASTAQSETDPTDRIDAEIRLFAPHENHSEQGSVRAPSPPASEASSDDRTPTNDVAGMPTPRVTGAFVETPATIKADAWSDARSGRNLMRGRDPDTASDPGTSDGHGREATAVRKRRRARSLPRRRPPLKNSAKPPSVRDDLLELQRTHNMMDDSTLDDVRYETTAQPAAPKQQKQKQHQSLQQKQQPVKAENAAEADEGRSVLGRVLLSTLEKTKSARRGIDRLIVTMSRRGDGDEDDDDDDDDDDEDDKAESIDDKVAVDKSSGKAAVERMVDDVDKKPARATPVDANDRKSNVRPEKSSMDEGQDCPRCQARLTSRSVTYIHIPVPRLYDTRPQFRLRLAGLLALLASIWLVAETATCARFCRPTRCSSASDCVFSFDDPHFGLALPIKLDDWTTGGRGRAALASAVEAVLDLLSDVSDAALGKSMVAPSTRSSMTAREKRRLRRRLSKRGNPFPGPSPPGIAEPTSKEQRERWDAWRRTRFQQERVTEARRMAWADDEGTGVRLRLRLWGG